MQPDNDQTSPARLPAYWQTIDRNATPVDPVKSCLGDLFGDHTTDPYSRTLGDLIRNLRFIPAAGCAAPHESSAGPQTSDEAAAEILRLTSPIRVASYEALPSLFERTIDVALDALLGSLQEITLDTISYDRTAALLLSCLTSVLSLLLPKSAYPLTSGLDPRMLTHLTSQAMNVLSQLLVYVVSKSGTGGDIASSSVPWRRDSAQRMFPNFRLLAVKAGTDGTISQRDLAVLDCSTAHIPGEQLDELLNGPQTFTFDELDGGEEVESSGVGAKEGTGLRAALAKNLYWTLESPDAHEWAPIGLVSLNGILWCSAVVLDEVSATGHTPLSGEERYRAFSNRPGLLLTSPSCPFDNPSCLRPLVAALLDFLAFPTASLPAAISRAVLADPALAPACAELAQEEHFFPDDRGTSWATDIDGATDGAVPTDGQPAGLALLQSVETVTFFHGPNYDLTFRRVPPLSACPPSPPILPSRSSASPSSLSLTLNERFRAHGASAIVWDCSAPSLDHPLVAKLFTREDVASLEAAAYLAASKVNGEPLVPRFYGHFRSDCESEVIILEAFGDSLKDFHNLSAAEKSTLFTLVSRLHLEAHLAHHDVAPRNVLLNDAGEMRLIDLETCTLHECAGVDACELLTELREELGLQPS